MRYTEYYSHLLTEGWKTYKPSNSPKTLLYDFYVLSYLTTLPLGPEQKGFSGNLIGRNPSEVKLDIDYAQSVLLPILSKKIKNALFLGICAEIRHLFDERQDYNSYKNNKLLKYYARYYSNLSGSLPPEFKPSRDVNRSRVNSRNKSYIYSYKAAMMAIKKVGSSKTAFVELAEDLFETMVWDYSYGGTKWAEICQGYLLLDKARTNNEKQVAIDHAYDLQHNTGTALNKVFDFSIDGDFGWIKKALDHKRYAKSMYDLLPNCSSDMRKLALEAFKIANVKKSTEIQKNNIDSNDSEKIANQQIMNNLKNNEKNVSGESNNIFPGGIYNVLEYGCLFSVNSIYPDEWSPYKQIAKGIISLVHDLEKFEKLKSLSSKRLKVGSSTAMYTDFLSSKYLNTGGALAYYAKDSYGELIIVGNEYITDKYGFRGLITQILPETTADGIVTVQIKEITDTVKYKLSMYPSVVGESLTAKSSLFRPVTGNDIKI